MNPKGKAFGYMHEATDCTIEDITVPKGHVIHTNKGHHNGDPVITPEPATFILLGIGLICLAGWSLLKCKRTLTSGS